MAIEKRWHEIAAIPFTADGTASGIIKVASVGCFKVKQKVSLKALGVTTQRLEIKSIPDCQTIVVGPTDRNKQKNNFNILARSDISAFTVALGATIEAGEQIRPTIPPTEHARAVFEEEPTVATRVYNVDKCGNPYTTDNPFPVDATFTGEVNLDHPNAEGMTVLNIPTKNTEVNFSFPNKLQFYKIKARDAKDVIKVGLAAGNITAGNYWTIEFGNELHPVQPNDFPDNYTLYFESKHKDDVNLEIWYWYFT